MSASKGETKVRTASRSIGGVAMIDISRTPVIASCSVRGIGVAESVSTCTSARSSFSRSLCPTPKCCSSSTTTRPRSLKLTVLPRTAWVPTTISTPPSARPFFTSRSFGRADHARELADVDRKAGEALAEVLRVLARQQRRRRDDRGLLAVDRRGEGGAQRDLGLAEADVAADQPVHRAAGGQIVERRVDRARLVRRLVIGKAGAEFVVQAFGGSEARRRMRHALGGDADELARHLAHALLQPRLARLPAGAAKLVEFARLRAVARQKLEILDRQEQAVAAGIVDFEAVMRRAGRLDGLQADEAPDAVIDMDDEIARGERARFGQHVLRAPPALRLAHEPVAENVLLAEKREVRRFEPLFERDDSERQRARARRRRLMIGGDEFERI